MLQLGCREPTQAKASFTTGSRLCLKEKGGAEGGSCVRDGSAQALLRPRVRAREPKSSNKQPRFHEAGERGLYNRVHAGGLRGLLQRLEPQFGYLSSARRPSRP